MFQRVTAGYWSAIANESSLVALSPSDGQFDASYNISVCVPPVGCLGNNTCATGYTGTACSICVPHTYHRDILSGDVYTLRTDVCSHSVIALAFCLVNIYHSMT